MTLNSTSIIRNFGLFKEQTLAIIIRAIFFPIYLQTFCYSVWKAAYSRNF